MDKVTRRRWPSKRGAIVRASLAMLLTVGGVVSASSVASASVSPAVSCSGGLVNVTHPEPGRFLHAHTIMYSGPAIYCSFRGIGEPADRLIYYCWVLVEDGTWTFLRNVSTGQQGWAKDSGLSNNGSGYHCS